MPRTPTIREEIQQTRPFRSRSQEAVLALMRTADDLKAHFGRVLAPYDITAQQYNVLRILRGAGKDGLPTLAIAERMIERSPGITRMIDRLEAKGLVTRERRSGDRRCVHCRITPDGLALLRRVDAPVAAADDRLATISRQDLATLIRILDRVRSTL